MRIAGYGSVLCHYTESATAFEEIMEKRELRFSPYERMRDPTESQDWVFGASYFPGSFAGREDEHQTRIAAQQATNELKRQTKLLAMTEDAPRGYNPTKLKEQMFGRGWARARMWEQYGEDHRGACLVFDRETLIVELAEGLEAVGAKRSYKGRVRYTPTGLAGELGALNFHLDNFKTKPMDEAVGEHLQQHYQELFLLKTLEWDSEHEYRFVAHKPDNDYLGVPFRDSLIAVVVGGEFPEREEPNALEACKGIGAEAYRLTWVHEGPLPVQLGKED